MNYSFPLSQAEKIEFLIDAQAYYSRFAEAALLGQKKIVIVGWDLHSQTSWQDPVTHKKVYLHEHLTKCLENNPSLQIYLLCWDFNLFVGRKREWWPFFSPERWGERIHFKKDAFHPLFSSHHQKIVLIDDQLAFLGGFDFCEGRWDTPEHRPFHQDRTCARGKSYFAFHDLQMMLHGPVVKDLIQVVNYRWEKATGAALPAVDKPWKNFDQLFSAEQPLIEDCPVQVCLTQPQYQDQQPLRENLRATVDMLRSAKKFIYIENQYLTHQRIVKVLIHLLRSRNGPQIVVLLPRVNHDRFEEYTIGILQRRAVNLLMQNDYWNRLRICYPRLEIRDEHPLYVHSKLIIVDDKRVKIGSSNLNHRSMGFDTECDLLIEATSPKHKKQIRHLRYKLLAEHLDSTIHVLSCQEERGYSLIQLIDEKRFHSRSLQEWPEGLGWSNWLVWSREPWFDRRRPLGLGRKRKWNLIKAFS